MSEKRYSEGAMRAWRRVRDMPPSDHKDFAAIISEETGDMAMRAALEAIGQGRTRDGIQSLMDLCDKWGCQPRGHAIPGYGDTVAAVARAALAATKGEDHGT